MCDSVVCGLGRAVSRCLSLSLDLSFTLSVSLSRTHTLAASLPPSSSLLLAPCPVCSSGDFTKLRKDRMRMRKVFDKYYYAEPQYSDPKRVRRLC